MKFFRTIVFAILTLFSFLPAPTKAQHANFPASECAQSADEFHLNDAVGSSEFMANLRGAEDSIRVVVKKFLDDALTSDLKLTCPDSCEQTGADIFYRAAPSAYMEQKKQRAICIELEHQTTEAPLQFARRHCESLEEMNDSLMLFSCGKSAQDKNPYQRCGSNCSPRYTFHIRDLQHSSLSVAAEVIYGLARDRSNKRYELSTSRQARCENVSQRTKLSK